MYKNHSNSHQQQINILMFCLICLYTSLCTYIYADIQNIIQNVYNTYNNTYKMQLYISYVILYISYSFIHVQFLKIQVTLKYSIMNSVFFLTQMILFLSFGSTQISFIVKYTKLSLITQGISVVLTTGCERKRKVLLTFYSTSGSQRPRHEFIQTHIRCTSSPLSFVAKSFAQFKDVKAHFQVSAYLQCP